MNKTWPLWWCIPVEAQRDLMEFQYDNYGYYMERPPAADERSIINTKLESLEGINAIKQVGLKYGRLPRDKR